MANSIGDDIGPDGGPVIPDVPQTALAFRTWRLSDSGRLLSINAPSLTGKAGGGPQQPRKIAWIHRAFAADGQDGWPVGVPLVAHCGVQGAAAEKNEDHGKIPAKDCSCGIYATTSMRIVNQYLGNEVIQGTIAIRGPVLGIVEMGGRVIPATQGFRAAYARVAAILQIDEAFSLNSSRLRSIAEFYRVPLIVPHSLDPADYREQIAQMPVSKPEDIGDEIEAELKAMFSDDDEGGEE
jgi:hypothetical protein